MDRPSPVSSAVASVVLPESPRRVLLPHQANGDATADLFHRQPVLHALERMIDEALNAEGANMRRGHVVGLLGAWGSGKSTVRELLRTRLRGRVPSEGGQVRPLLVSVNAWTLPQRDFPHHLVVEVAEAWAEATDHVPEKERPVLPAELAPEGLRTTLLDEVTQPLQPESLAGITVPSRGDEFRGIEVRAAAGVGRIGRGGRVERTNPGSGASAGGTRPPIA